MSNEDLRVDYDGLKQDTVVQLTTCANRLADVYGEMRNTVLSLGLYMESKSAESYVNEFNELVGPSIEKMENLVREYYTQLNQIAARFAEADNAMARRISSNI